MRVAQIAPLHEAVSPKLYGGTEQVGSHLANPLVEWGHDVTRFASGALTTQAEAYKTPIDRKNNEEGNALFLI